MWTEKNNGLEFASQEKTCVGESAIVECAERAEILDFIEPAGGEAFIEEDDVPIELEDTINIRNDLKIPLDPIHVIDLGITRKMLKKLMQNKVFERNSSLEEFVKKKHYKMFGFKAKNGVKYSYLSEFYLDIKAPNNKFQKVPLEELKSATTTHLMGSHLIFALLTKEGGDPYYFLTKLSTYSLNTCLNAITLAFVFSLGRLL
ncbi:hypothetical protein FF38_12377 [Lucilia cuprina]|uniref:Uncharacterized protein n=1 Tax=Lucilia cuprina TaxID=7375 RepID=A0A0L0CDV5_LUCCU|nr:hypothetical protein FF38_12377 [Lucilia cuprina]